MVINCTKYYKNLHAYCTASLASRSWISGIFRMEIILIMEIILTIEVIRIDKIPIANNCEQPIS